MKYPLKIFSNKAPLALLALLCLFAAPAFAHHAMEVHYLVSDEAIVEKEGVVKNFSLLDPHSYLVVTVEEDGESTDWVLEGRSRVVLTRAGWRFDMLKPGAEIRFIAYPARSGETAGRILSIEVNGEVYCSDRCDLLGVEIPEFTETSNQSVARSMAVASAVSD